MSQAQHTQHAESRNPQIALDLPTLLQHGRALLPAFAKGASARESERQLPYQQVKELAQAKLLALRVPRRYGGPGASVRDVIDWLIDVAAADSNIAQSLRPAYLYLEVLLAGDDEAARQHWATHYLAGEFVGNAGWEIGGANGAISSRIVAEGDHFRVNGSKYYSTGSLYSNWLTITALNEQDQETRFIIPSDREGVELVDDFDAMGQRLTASGTTRLNNVRVDANELVRNPQYRDGKAQRTIVTPFAQLFLAATLAGIARNVLHDAIEFTRHVARPIKHSSAQKSVDDPYVTLRVGHISAQAFAARAAVLQAADKIDAAWAAGLDNDAVVAASIDVAQAQYIAAAAALDGAQALFDVAGASATSRKHNLDRHWRNARTVTNHNPRDWKAAVVGAYYLKDQLPPTSGLF
jgi:alkylation response protein AidB-like acyl-CoA dehydrogenase